MKRVIVDYSKLTGEILNLLVEKFPDGYDDSDIIRFKNAKNETIEAVEVRTVDTVFLVKISTKLSDRIINYDEDDELGGSEAEAEDSLDALKDLEIDDVDDDAPKKSKKSRSNDDDDDDDVKSDYDDEDDEDDDDDDDDPIGEDDEEDEDED
jgi:DNA-directed RNA polymerase subunit delta